MKKISFICLLLFIICTAKSQITSFNCSSYAEESSEMKMKTYGGTINVIDEKVVEVTSFQESGTRSLVFKVDSVVTKNFFARGESKWYYGKDTKNDGYGNYRKEILIQPLKDSGSKKLYLFEFADEVTIFKYMFFYK